MRVLVVEDEPAISDFVERGLRADGYAVEVAGDGLEGERRALSGDYDLLVLDVMLPGKSGLEVLAAVRQVDPVLPVVLLTARGEVQDRVEGLDAGATDYIAKPFSFDELAARVRAHLRTRTEAEPTTLGVEGIRADLLSRRVVVGEGREVALSGTEFDLLAFFLRNPDHVVSREQILRAVWGYDHEPGTNIVQVYVGYLRRKLGDAGGRIETLRSAGYRLRSRE